MTPSVRTLQGGQKQKVLRGHRRFALGGQTRVAFPNRMARVINLYVGIATCFSTMILFSNCLFMLNIFESLPCKYTEILSIILYDNIYLITFSQLNDCPYLYPSTGRGFK